MISWEGELCFSNQAFQKLINYMIGPLATEVYRYGFDIFAKVLIFRTPIWHQISARSLVGRVVLLTLEEDIHGEMYIPKLRKIM